MEGRSDAGCVAGEGGADWGWGHLMMSGTEISSNDSGGCEAVEAGRNIGCFQKCAMTLAHICALLF